MTEPANSPPLHHSNTPIRLFSDYHMHPQGHRVQPYTQELLQPWINAARARGLNDIAFTDHDRFHAGVDFGAIDQLREKNVDLKIRAGIELDNDPESSPAGRKWVEKNWDKLDSVPAGAAQFEGRNIEAIYADYFRRVREIAATGLVDCLAHIDLVKIHGHRPTARIEDLIEETLEFIRSRNLAIELSTAGWRKPVKELYPSDEIIRLAMEKDIAFTTASDAHSHVQLGENFERLAEKMSILGLREVCVYEKHERRAVMTKHE